MSSGASSGPVAPKRRRLRAVITGLLTILILSLVFWQVDPAPVLGALAHSDLPLVMAVVAIAFLFNTVQSAELLRHMLGGFGVEVRFRDALAATVGNLALHATLPLGAGNLTRVAYLQRVAGIDVTRSTVAALTALWLKLLALLALASVGWMLLPGTHAAHGLVVVGGFGGLLAATLLSPRASRWLAGKTRPSGKVGRLAASLGQAASDIRPRRLLLGAIHALVAVGIELVVFWLLLVAVGARAPALHILALFPLTVIGAKVPITFLGLGTREALAVAFFSSESSADDVLAATLLYSGAEHVLPALVGTLLAWHFVRALVEGHDRNPATR